MGSVLRRALGKAVLPEYYWEEDSVGRESVWGGLRKVLAVAVTCLVVLGAVSVVSLAAARRHSRKQKLADYRLLAAQLAMPIHPSREQFNTKRDHGAVIADGYAKIMSLGRIRGTDPDVDYLAKQGREAIAQVIDQAEQLRASPRPRSVETLILTSACDVLANDFPSAAGRLRAQIDRSEGVNDRLVALSTALDKLDAAHQALPSVARNYAAPSTAGTGRISVDFDECLGFEPLEDWVSLQNSGAALSDCTVVVVIEGADGSQRQNVHFVETWPAGGRLHARYRAGRPVGERMIGRATVIDVQEVHIEVISPAYSEQASYTYVGKERDKDVQAWCQEARFELHYHPQKRHLLLFQGHRRVDLSLTGVRGLPAGELQLTFHCGDKARTAVFSSDVWKQGERRAFRPSPDLLPSDPSRVDLVLAFPRSEYRYEATWRLR